MKKLLFIVIACILVAIVLPQYQTFAAILGIGAVVVYVLGKSIKWLAYIGLAAIAIQFLQGLFM